VDEDGLFLPTGMTMAITQNTTLENIHIGVNAATPAGLNIGGTGQITLENITSQVVAGTENRYPIYISPNVLGSPTSNLQVFGDNGAIGFYAATVSAAQMSKAIFTNWVFKPMWPQYLIAQAPNGYTIAKIKTDNPAYCATNNYMIDEVCL
jgi:hypothetical protein